MDSIDLLRVAALCVLLAGAETLHGIARTVVLAPRIGKARAIKLGAVTGSLLAFAICFFFVPAIGASGFRQLFLLGLGLAGFMAAFDVAIGRLVMRLRWPRIWQDFNPASGNYLSVGLLLLAFMPCLVGWLRSGAAP